MFLVITADSCPRTVQPGYLAKNSDGRGHEPGGVGAAVLVGMNAWKQRGMYDVCNQSIIEDHVRAAARFLFLFFFFGDIVEP
jgi:hypothetical protein